MKEKDNKNTEVAILEAADRLFKENGFKGTTTTMIAGQAGVTHAMLHYYFRTKEQIFIKVLDGYILKMHDELRMTMSPGKGMLETLREVTATLFDFMRAHTGELRLLLEIAETNPEFLTKYKEGIGVMMTKAFARHDERLKDAVDKGLIAPVTMENLILEIILADYSVFALMPMIKLTLGNDQVRIDKFLDEQKTNAVNRVTAFLKK